MGRCKKIVSVVIPAYNEEETIGSVAASSRVFSDEVIVVDDGSTDQTAMLAEKAGAFVVYHEKNMGYLDALRTGFKHASNSIIVTLDADGQHNPDDIPRLTRLILNGEADLVIGARERLASFSEKILTKLTRLRVKVSDASSGYKAIKSEVAKKMKLKGKCICGTFILEAAELGARIKEVKVRTDRRKAGKSRVRKKHFMQMLIVLKEVLCWKKRSECF